MKVFISWSGEVSHKIALELRDWIPTVLQFVETWVSSEDIEKGKRWGLELAKQLEQSRFGIICIDPTNISSPWLNFEAGAISRFIDNSSIVPFLCNMKPGDLTGPLAQFQVAIPEEDDVKKMIHSINKVSGDAKLPDEKLETSFRYLWPGLLKNLSEIEAPKLAHAPSKRKMEISAEAEHYKKEISEEQKQILILVAEIIDRIDEDYVEQYLIRSRMNLSKQKLLYVIGALENLGYVRTDQYGDIYITSKGTAYLVENDLV